MGEISEKFSPKLCVGFVKVSIKIVEKCAASFYNNIIMDKNYLYML